MATLLTAWTPKILTQVVGVPVPGIKYAVREAAKTFCDETFLWTFTLDRISVVSDTRTYDLTVPVAQNGEVVSILNVKYKPDGADDDEFKRLDPISEKQQDLLDSGSWSFLSSPRPNYFYSDFVNKQINFYQIPTEASASGLLVKVALRPIGPSDDVPDFLLTDFEDEIADGALEVLFGSKAMPWYDPEKMLFHGTLFKDACADGRQKRITGPTNRPMRVRMRNWV